MSQFRSNFTSTPHIMPTPPSIPWNSEAMPWTISAPYPKIMEFNATPTSSLTNQISINKTNFNIHSYKRKSDIPLPTPSKQFITEEKMAAHLNGLHISPDYISHDINQTTLNTDQQNTNSISDISMDLDTNNDYILPMTAKDLEEKLKNANKITVCDALKKFHEEDTIVPKALLSRIEKPCTALILWQPPPQKIRDLITNKSQRNEFNIFGAGSSSNATATATTTVNNTINNDVDVDDNEFDEDQQNNNSSTLDYNYGMETDM